MKEPLYWINIKVHDGLYDIHEKMGTKKEYKAEKRQDPKHISKPYEEIKHTLYWFLDNKGEPDPEAIVKDLRADIDRVKRYKKLENEIREYYDMLDMADCSGYDTDDDEVSFLRAYDKMLECGKIEKTARGLIWHIAVTVKTYDKLIENRHNLKDLKSNVKFRWLIKSRTDEGWELSEKTGSYNEFHFLPKDTEHSNILKNMLPHKEIHIHPKPLINEPDIKLSEQIVTDPVLGMFLEQIEDDGFYAAVGDNKSVGFPAGENQEKVVNFCVSTQIYAQSIEEYKEKITDKIVSMYDKCKDIIKDEKEKMKEEALQMEELDVKETEVEIDSSEEQRTPAEKETVEHEASEHEDSAIEMDDIMDLGDIDEIGDIGSISDADIFGNTEIESADASDEKDLDDEDYEFEL